MKEKELIVSLTEIIQIVNTIPFNDQLTKDKILKRLEIAC